MNQQDSAPPKVFRVSPGVQVSIVVLGLIGIATGWLLHVTLSTGPMLTFPVVFPVVLGALWLLMGLSYYIRPSPAVAVDDDGLVLRPFGRIPWSAISRVHVTTAKIDPNMRYLSIELVEPNPKLAERRWPRWIHGPINKLVTGHPVTVPENLLRPISLDDIAAELHRRNPDLVIIESVQPGFRRGVRKRYRMSRIRKS
ncbi:hypothetical protein [Nocardia carnea]|uniref:hypothetical protein n=1 Tax=Nocardia carnea TaxID=37328 RepID=UPI00245652EF|nr:hypothetical protein [Nocardia carnea]